MRKISDNRFILFITESFALFLVILLFIYGFNQYASISAQPFVYNSIESVPKHKVGLLLGTSKYMASGYINLYYKYRIDATLELFNAHKIEYVIVSGDNRKHNYNEPEEMKRDLIERGIPAEKIFLDYAGFRTLDSIIRAKEIFGQNKFIIISQEFHNERAICIAKYYGIKAIGYNAKNVTKQYGFKTMLREKLARVKLYIDLLIGVEPHFLGESISIP